MASLPSRYRRVPVAVARDAQGRARRSTGFRPYEPAPPVLAHTIEAMDRLDHLGMKYYRQPRKWWRICDANPSIPSPPELLGKTPLVGVRFPVTIPGGGSPPWPEALRALAALTGVESVEIVESARLETVTRVVAGQPVSVETERFERAVVVRYNRLNLAPPALAATLQAAGFTVLAPEPLERVGQELLVPADAPA